MDVTILSNKWETKYLEGVLKPRKTSDKEDDLDDKNDKRENAIKRDVRNRKEWEAQRNKGLERDVYADDEDNKERAE